MSRKKLRRLFVTTALIVALCLLARRCLARSSLQQVACGPRPNLQYSNEHWQTARVGGGGVEAHLLGAYYDARAVDAPTPVLRLVAMADTTDLSAATLHCQLWLEGRDAPVVVGVTRAALVWHGQWATGRPRDYHPYLVTCDLPPTLPHIPSSVSLVSNPCDRATNMLRVVYQPPAAKRNFAVCVKGLDYPQTDYSLRLVEWIELLRLLGAEKIIFYKLQVHANMARVLDLYQGQGLVEVIPITLPGNQPNQPMQQHLYLQNNKIWKRLNEVVSFNDCFYRHFGLFKYVVVLDIDEVIMPVSPLRTWEGMIDAVKAVSERSNKSYSSFYARHVYFFDENLDQRAARDIPGHLHMARHVYRAANFTGPTNFVKSFLDTERVITLHNHLPLSCRGGRRCWFPIPTSVGQLNHYRRDCENSLWRVCGEYKNNSVLDTTIWRYKDELTSRTMSVIDVLGLVNIVTARH